MGKLKCDDCGQIFDEVLQCCPDCGCPKSACHPYEEPKQEDFKHDKPKQEERQENKQSEQSTAFTQRNCTIETSKGEKVSTAGKDYAHYIYECGVLFWYTLTSNFANFSGRASRRETWSFIVISFLFLVPTYIGVFIAVIPSLAVGVRRMHDIGKSGWWIIVPIASTFLSLKKSDEGLNAYGEPIDYSKVLQ